MWMFRLKSAETLFFLGRTITSTASKKSGEGRRERPWEAFKLSKECREEGGDYNFFSSVESGQDKF